VSATAKSPVNCADSAGGLCGFGNTILPDVAKRAFGKFSVH
jgi:hypothetical protein